MLNSYLKFLLKRKNSRLTSKHNIFTIKFETKIDCYIFSTSLYWGIQPTLKYAMHVHSTTYLLQIIGLLNLDSIAMLSEEPTLNSAKLKIQYYSLFWWKRLLLGFNHPRLNFAYVVAQTWILRHLRCCEIASFRSKTGATVRSATYKNVRYLNVNQLWLNYH